MTFQTIVTNILYFLDQVGGLEVLGVIFTVTIGIFIWRSFTKTITPKQKQTSDDDDDD
jgi:hypothetical protein